MVMQAYRPGRIAEIRRIEPQCCQDTGAVGADLKAGPDFGYGRGLF
jgi:hypothetical protein